jgi:lipid-binding SYLF domain-containing protein
MARTEGALAHLIVAAVAAVLMTAPAGYAAAEDRQESGGRLTADQKKHKIAEIRKIRDKTLARLYREKPEARAEIARAVGYAVFDASRLNMFLLVGASGYGVLVDNTTRKETFMSMTRARTGPGVGYKSFRQVLVFNSRALFDRFRSVGVDLSTVNVATVKVGSKGASIDGAVSLNPGLSVYQMTDRGLLLQANWGGVAYLPDLELNTP